ncbi:MAG: TetR/AcrR family transcriptional repressor of nem operon [Candidatus Krumholzibacteriia bacterium]|jgi:TetR/AcrR family transcriptional repressor of nem operon
MARPRNFDESQVLEGAVALFRESGFEGTSVPDITSRLGICRQSLYTTFGDKRGLYLKALQVYGQRETDTKLALLKNEGSPLENVRTVVRALAALAATCPSDGCLIVGAIVENHDDQEIREFAEHEVERFESGLQAALTEAQDKGELLVSARPAKIARAITTAMFGIGLLIRLPKSGPRVADTVSVLLELIDETAA